uniref:Uncharacterized protein n=1 Tax=Physcomitrium patens TaxID=3218 RepID=A0A2K1KQ92_PHYPA|nr:hypothetical protein PHYPA_006851 [Physcomitrium patens]
MGEDTSIRERLTQLAQISISEILIVSFFVYLFKNSQSRHKNAVLGFIASAVCPMRCLVGFKADDTPF